MARTCKEQSIVQGLLLLQRAPASISLGAPYGGRILLLSNETRLRSNKAVFKSGGMHPWLKIRGKYKRARLKSEARAGNPAGFFIGRTPTMGARQIFLGMPNTTYGAAPCDFCATFDFWTLQRDSCIKRYPSGVCPSPARETAPGFSLGGRGAPQKRLGFLRPQRRGPKRKRFLATASPHPKPQNQQRSALEKPLRRERRTHVIWWDEEEESERDVRLRVERMIAQGKAHPDDRFFYVSWRR